jgi:hypothetical protein
MFRHNFMIGKVHENHVFFGKVHENHVCFGRISGSQLRGEANAGQHTPALPHTTTSTIWYSYQGSIRVYVHVYVLYTWTYGAWYVGSMVPVYSIHVVRPYTRTYQMNGTIALEYVPWYVPWYTHTESHGKRVGTMVHVYHGMIYVYSVLQDHC